MAEAGKETAERVGPLAGKTKGSEQLVMNTLDDLAQSGGVPAAAQ
jgi:hypothetical protein